MWHEPSLGPHGRLFRPTIRSWFAGAGFEEVAFLAGEDGSWGVGANRLVAEPAPYQAGVRLFTFLDHLP